jgi:flagellar protein FliL
MSEAAPAEAAPKPKKKKLLMMVIVAAVVLVGGGVGAYFMLGSHGDEKGKDKGKKEAKAEVKLPAQFVALEPPFVVNFDAGASARFLQITVQVMTRDPLLLEFLKTHDPIIRNDLLLLFGNKKVEEVSTNEGKEQLRTAALEAIKKIAKDEGEKPEAVEAVYFTSFVMQ